MLQTQFKSNSSYSHSEIDAKIENSEMKILFENLKKEILNHLEFEKKSQKNIYKKTKIVENNFNNTYKTLSNKIFDLEINSGILKTQLENYQTNQENNTINFSKLQNVPNNEEFKEIKKQNNEFTKTISELNIKIGEIPTFDKKFSNKINNIEKKNDDLKNELEKIKKTQEDLEFKFGKILKEQNETISEIQNKNIKNEKEHENINNQIDFVRKNQMKNDNNYSKHEEKLQNLDNEFRKTEETISDLSNKFDISSKKVEKELQNLNVKIDQNQKNIEIDLDKISSNIENNMNISTTENEKIKNEFERLKLNLPMQYLSNKLSDTINKEIKNDIQKNLNAFDIFKKDVFKNYLSVKNFNNKIKIFDNLFENLPNQYISIQKSNDENNLILKKIDEIKEDSKKWDEIKINLEKKFSKSEFLTFQINFEKMKKEFDELKLEIPIQYTSKKLSDELYLNQKMVSEENFLKISDTIQKENKNICKLIDEQLLNYTTLTSFNNFRQEISQNLEKEKKLNSDEFLKFMKELEKTQKNIGYLDKKLLDAIESSNLRMNKNKKLNNLQLGGLESNLKLKSSKIQSKLSLITSGGKLIEKNFFITLENLIGLSKKLTIIYTASKNSYSCLEFHNSLQDKSKFLVLIKTQNNCLFGFYTEKTFDPEYSFNKKYISDKSAIIFSLIVKNSTNICKFPIDLKNYKSAIFTDKNIFFALGEGYDLYIPNGCDKSASTVNFPCSFLAPNENLENKKFNHFLGGENSFLVEELELYHVENI